MPQPSTFDTTHKSNQARFPFTRVEIPHLVRKPVMVGGNGPPPEIMDEQLGFGSCTAHPQHAQIRRADSTKRNSTVQAGATKVKSISSKRPRP